MKIQNNYSGPIWWWSYREGDATYAIALNKGEVPAGQSKGWSDDSFPKFKLQIARDWKSLGINNYTTILEPGTIYSKDDNFIVDAQGKGVTKAEVVTTPEPTIEKRMISTQFIDRRGKTENREEEITTEFSKAFSKSISETQTDQHSKTWNIGGKISGAYKGVTGEISGGFEDKVVKTLEHQYKESVEESLKEVRKTKIELEANKISMIKTVWLAQIQTGTVSYFGQTASFYVPIGADASATLEVETTFDSPEDMDAETRATWDKLQSTN